MVDLVEDNREVISEHALAPKLFKLMQAADITEIQGYFGHLIKNAAEEKVELIFLKSICDAFTYFNRENPNDWEKKLLHELCNNSDYDTDKVLSYMAELEAFGHLSAAFSSVSQIPECDGKKGKTPDFKVDDNLFVEVYCPDESHDERKRKKDDQDKFCGQINTETNNSECYSIKSHLGFYYPKTGYKLIDGDVPALKYSTNKIIARILNAKRNTDQFADGVNNILWLDLKYKLKCRVEYTLPMHSHKRGGQIFVSCPGIWHAFYGKIDCSVFFGERFNLKFDKDFYTQNGCNGIFRERVKISGAVISCVDGNVVFLNPWCPYPLTDEQIRRLTHISNFRPEYSYFNKNTLESDIASKDESIALLKNLSNPKEG